MAMLVVCLHVSILREVTHVWSWLARNGIFRIAVPVFLLINGYYFYESLEEGRQWAWIKRLLDLYVLWTTIYAIFWADEPSLQILRFMTFGWYHLWYLVGVIGAALSLLALTGGTIKGRAQTTIIASVALVTFFAGVVIQYAGNLGLFQGSLAWILGSTEAHRNFLFFAFPFFAMGYVIRRHALAERVSPIAAGALTLFGFCALISESLLNFRLHSADTDNMLSLAILTPALFILVIQLPQKGSRGKMLSTLANGIYFTHVAFILVIHRYFGLSSVPLTIVVVLCALAASALLLPRRKQLRWIL